MNPDHQRHYEDQPDPVFNVLIEMVQPRADRFAAKIAKGSKNQRPNDGAKNIQR